uniref:Uncharacterized protein n=1 Tax=Rhizophora mucronata TaxID=61149 RepID=A0A2P2LAB8_RHIMU
MAIYYLCHHMQLTNLKVS